MSSKNKVSDILELFLLFFKLRMRKIVTEIAGERRRETVGLQEIRGKFLAWKDGHRSLELHLEFQKKRYFLNHIDFRITYVNLSKIHIKSEDE